MKTPDLKSKHPETIRDLNEKPAIDTVTTNSLEKIPFFSVCIPTYNRASFLPQAIESVLTQDFTDFELVICDNASNDNTQAVVEKYQDRRIRYVRYENLVGMYANHNRCIDLARAEWLVFLHSDDSFGINAFNIINTKINSFPELDILLQSANNSGFMSDLERLISFSITNENKLSWQSIILILTNDGFPPSGGVFRKIKFESIGLFDESYFCLANKNYCYWSDTALELLWIIKGGNIVISNDFWIDYSKGSQSAFQQMLSSPSYYKAHKIVFDTFFNEYKDTKIDDVVAILKELPTGKQILFLKRCFQSGYKKYALLIEHKLHISFKECWADRNYKYHVFPLKIMPEVYWQILTTFKWIKSWSK